MRIGKRIALWIATGFGLGYIPVAPGTFGTLLGIPLALLMRGWPWWWQAIYCLVLALLAVWICDIAEGILGTKDDRRIVADEYATLPICMIGMLLVNSYDYYPPLNVTVIVVFAFIIHRMMDIIKPFPARRLQSLHGGLGIVIDDVISSVYGLVVGWLIFFVLVILGILLPTRIIL